MSESKVYCDGCSSLAINGHASHEQGCPNRSKPWIIVESDEGPWALDDGEKWCIPDENWEPEEEQ